MGITSSRDYGIFVVNHGGGLTRRVLMRVFVSGCVLLVASLFHPVCAEFEAGVATIDITAPVGTPLAGYGDRWGRPSTGIHDPVYARALYLSDGETPVVMVTSDLIGIFKDFRDRVLAHLPDDLGVPHQNILLSATHTHSSQGAMINVLVAKIATGRYDEEVLEETAKRFAGVIQSAVEAKRPARFGYGSGEDARLSSNRARDGGPTDPVITVIRIDNDNGEPFAILTDFTAHPTVLSDRNMLFSADYPGYFVDHVQELYGGSVVAMFANGAEGDQGPGNPDGNSGFARAESIGKLLAEDVKKTAGGIKTADRVKLRVGYSEPQLPPSVFERVLRQPTTVIQTVEINDLVLMAVPGEMCVEIGLNLKRMAVDLGYSHAIIVGLANDHLGYFVPRSYFDREYYETAMNFHGPRVEDFFYREVMALPSRAKAGQVRTRGPEIKAPDVTERSGIHYLVLEGDPYEIGYKHGAAMRESIGGVVNTLLYEEPARRREIVLPASAARLIPRFLDVMPLYIPFVAARVRLMNRFVDERFRLEIEGMSAASGVSYDELFLANTFFTVTAQSDKGDVARLPMCTNLAASGSATESGRLVVGRNLDLDVKRPFVDKTTVFEFRPRGGFSFISVAWPGSTGVFTAMNEKGIVVAPEGVAAEKTTLDGVPMNMLLRKVMQDAGSLPEAVRMIQAEPTTCAYNVLVADAKLGEAQVVQIGPGRSSVRAVHDGLLFGRESAGGEAGRRYERARRLADSARGSLDVQRVMQILIDRNEAGVWNRGTVHSVVFEPTAGQVYVAQPDAAGAPGEYVSFSLEMNLE